MTATITARKRNMQKQIGPSGLAIVYSDNLGRVKYAVRCQLGCETHGRPWRTDRYESDNTYLAAMYRWVLHLDKRHPEAPAAPSDRFLPDAKAWRHEQHRVKDAVVASLRGQLDELCASLPDDPDEASRIIAEWWRAHDQEAAEGNLPG